MKILILCSANSGQIASFIQEQVVELNALGIETDYFLIKQKGITGYLKAREGLLRKISQFEPDLIHAHYGLSGLLGNLQRKVPVITTYHGCDINEFPLRIFSIFSILLSGYNIFVSKKQVGKVKFWLRNYSIIPCGVDYNVFYPVPKKEARLKLGLNQDRKIILFSSTFDRYEKNAPLAIQAVENIANSELIQLKGYTRDQVCLLMNASDVGLLTSFHEGSPVFIKELLACKRPIVSTNVGDVEESIGMIEGCEIVPFKSVAVTKAIQHSFFYDHINVPEGLTLRNDNRKITKDLLNIYKSVVSKNPLLKSTLLFK